MHKYYVEYEVNTPYGIVDDGIIEDIEAENEQKARLNVITKLKAIYPNSNIQIINATLTE